MVLHTGRRRRPRGVVGLRVGTANGSRPGPRPSRAPGRYPLRVTATRSEPVPLGLLAQISRFVTVGALSALVDFGVYHALLALGTWVHLAKAVSFILGTTTAYLLNRRFTFAAAAGGRRRFLGFVLL